MKFLKFFCIASLTLAITTPVMAEENKDNAAPQQESQSLAKSSRFAPDFCDFEITFPEAPFSAKKCVAENECFEVKSYTMVYDLSTTVDVSVTCSPSTPEAYKRYNEKVMKAALAGMISDRQLNEHQMAFKEFEKTKNAVINGTGKTGAQDKMYAGQLWVGPNSVFTIQAELVGGAHPVADKSFYDILSSIKEKEGKQLPAKEEKSSPPVKEKNQ